jgi:hypothetical protein
VFPRRATGLDLLYQTTWRGWTFDATMYGPAEDQLAPLRVLPAAAGPRRRGAAGWPVLATVPNLILKADYLFGTRRVEDFQPGFQAAVSLLF